MKRLKVFGAALTLAIMVLIFSAFTVSSYHSKAFDKICYSYIGTTLIPRVGPWSAAQEAAFKNTANWSAVTEAEVIALCPDNTYICGFCYDPTGETYSGSLQNALNATWNLRNSWQAGVQLAGTDGADTDTDGITPYFKD